MRYLIHTCVFDINNIFFKKGGQSPMKKKLVCLLTALTVLSCAVPVFAAQSSTATQPVVGATTSNPNVKVEVQQTVTETVKAEAHVQAETAAKALAEKLVAAGNLTETQAAEVKASVLAVVEINVDIANEDIPAEGISLTITADGVKAGDNIVLLHQKKDGTWETITPSSVKDGEITATFTSFSPVAIVKMEVPTTTETKTDETSPKTGVLPVLPVAALVCVAGAAVCGRKAKAE